jgi:hypothetical protein
MASKAHVIPGYSFHNAGSRPRREVWYRSEDPVVLPRSSVWSVGGGLIIAAFAASALLVAGAYAVTHTETAVLAETPMTPLEKDWTPSVDTTRANVTNVLSGPAFAAPSLATLAGGTDAAADMSSIVTDESHGYVIDDSAPGAQQRFPQSSPPSEPSLPQNMSPAVMPPATYPNPTTTPPEGIAPPDATPRTPTPVTDPENPY